MLRQRAAMPRACSPSSGALIHHACLWRRAGVMMLSAPRAWVSFSPWRHPWAWYSTQCLRVALSLRGPQPQPSRTSALGTMLSTREAAALPRWRLHLNACAPDVRVSSRWVISCRLWTSSPAQSSSCRMRRGRRVPSLIAWLACTPGILRPLTRSCTERRRLLCAAMRMRSLPRGRASLASRVRLLGMVVLRRMKTCGSRWRNNLQQQQMPPCSGAEERERGMRLRGSKVRCRRAWRSPRRTEDQCALILRRWHRLSSSSAGLRSA
mmetsp:Transcript_18115/g.56847  ORF Transcript_18115/g.56847 Transcript_18115/m.56847 type:complete len:266 (+) Transcript_18115:86-883(+)